MIRSVSALLLTVGAIGCGGSVPVLTGKGSTHPREPASTPTPAATPSGEVTKLTGTLVCGRCNLNLMPKCTNTLQVREGDKTVNYFLDDKGAKEAYHEEICGDGKLENTTVFGHVAERDGKKFITPSRPVEFVK